MKAEQKQYWSTSRCGATSSQHGFRCCEILCLKHNTHWHCLTVFSREIFNYFNSWWWQIQVKINWKDFLVAERSITLFKLENSTKRNYFKCMFKIIHALFKVRKNQRNQIISTKDFKFDGLWGKKACIKVVYYISRKCLWENKKKRQRRWGRKYSLEYE